MSRYSCWGCGVYKPADTASSMHFTKQEIADKIKRNEFTNMPVRFEHSDETLGRVGHAYQAKQGSLFLRLDLEGSRPETEATIGAIRQGKIRGVSLSHNPLNKQLNEVSITTVPGREGCYLLPQGPQQAVATDPTRVNFSYFDSLEYVGQPLDSSQMSQPVTQAPPAEVKAPEVNPAPEAKPAADKPEVKPAGDKPEVAEELTPEKLATIAKTAKAIHEENERMKKELESLRKKTEPLERQRVEEVKKYVGTVIEKLARETPEQKAKAEEMQRKLTQSILEDETLSSLVLETQKQSAEQKLKLPDNPREEEVRSSLKRGREMTSDMRDLLHLAADSKRDVNTGQWQKNTKSELNPVLQTIFNEAFSAKAPQPVAAYSQDQEKYRQIVEAHAANYNAAKLQAAPVIQYDSKQFVSVDAWTQGMRT